jgi:hypothetical protein
MQSVSSSSFTTVALYPELPLYVFVFLSGFIQAGPIDLDLRPRLLATVEQVLGPVYQWRAA